MGNVSPNDVEFVEDVAGDDWYGDCAVYAFNSGTLIKLPKSGKLEVSLRVLTCELYTICPRFLIGKMEGQSGDFPLVFKEEVKNRGVHAAARGGNLICLKEPFGNCDDVLEYRDVNGPAILHGTIGVNKGVNRTMFREKNLLKN